MKIYHIANVFLLLAIAVGLASSSLWAEEDGLGTNVVRNLRVVPDGTLSLGGTAITNWTLLPVSTGAVSLVDFEAWSNAVQNATNALNTNKLDLSGGEMTGPLTNEAGFFGDGAGVTNLNATNLNGMVNAASLGSNTANAGVFLRGDQAWTNEIVGNATATAFAVNTNQLIVTNGKVGIGTNNPSTNFHVAGGMLNNNSVEFNRSGGATVGDFSVSGSVNPDMYFGRLSGTSGDNTKFYFRNRLGLVKFSIDLGAAGDIVNMIENTAAGSIIFKDSAAEWARFYYKNFFLGASSSAITLTADWASNASKILVIGTGVAATNNSTDAVQLYSQDTGGTAGKAGLHIRTEDGTKHVLGNKVGLGTTNASEMLTVAGNVTATGTNTALIFVGDGSGLTNLNATNLTGAVNAASLGSNTANAGVFLRGDQAWTNALAGNATTVAFAVNTNQFIVTNGNVGIGYTNPTNGITLASGKSQRLYYTDEANTNWGALILEYNTVAGVAALRTASYRNNEAKKIRLQTIFSEGPIATAGTYLELDRQSQPRFKFFSDQTTTAGDFTEFAFTSIATTNTANFFIAKPIVNQSGAAGYGVFVLDVTETALGSGTKRLFSVNAGGTNRAVILNTGNMGIGTNNPSEKLEVVGNIKASGTNTAAAFNLIKYTGNTATTSGKVYQWNTNVWDAAVNTNAEMCNRMLAIAIGANSTTNGMLIRGELTVTNTDLSPGAGIFIDETAGEWTQTVPTTAGYILRSIGYAVETNQIYFNPDGMWAEIQ